MKIAICMSGQPRFLDQTYENHKNIIDKDQVETFLHCWWQDDHCGKTKMFHSTERFSEIDMGKLFLDVYKPLDSIIEGYQDFDLKFCKSHNYETWALDGIHQKQLDIFTPAMLYSQLSQTLSIKKSVELSGGHNFDIVVRMRSDVVITKELFSILRSLPLRDDLIFTQSAMGGGHIYGGEFPNSLCDWFYCGTPKAMSLYANSAHNSIKEVCIDGVKHNRDLMKIYAERAGLQPVLCDFGALIYRQLHENKNFRKVNLYYEEFDSNRLEITHNHDLWPIFHPHIDFKFLKSDS